MLCLEVLAMVAAAIDRGGVAGQLFIAFAGIGGVQFVKTFQPEDLQGRPGRAQRERGTVLFNRQN